MKFFLFLSFLSIGLPALAQSSAKSAAPVVSPSSCYEIDLRAQFPAVHDQGTTNWCYAFVIAALASQKLNRDISPVDVANTTERVPPPLADRLHDAVLFRTQPPRRVVFDGQTYLKALTAAQKKGFCLEADLPSSGMVGPVTDLKASLDSLEDVVGRNPLLLKPLAPHLSSNALMSLAKPQSGVPVIDRIDDLACQARIFPAQPWQLVSQRDDFNAKDTQSKINIVSDFLKNHVPLAIGMDAQLFFDPHWGDSPVPEDGRRSEHAVIVVGQHWDDSTHICHYIVRDSYGTACNRYSKDIQCLQGYYLLPREHLMNVTFEINYLK